jgi:hypothetical protein
VPGFGLCGDCCLIAIGRRPAASRGCLKRSLNSRSRYHALRIMHKAGSVGFRSAA